MGDVLLRGYVWQALRQLQCLERVAERGGGGPDVLDQQDVCRAGTARGPGHHSGPDQPEGTTLNQH